MVGFVGLGLVDTIPYHELMIIIYVLHTIPLSLLVSCYQYHFSGILEVPR